MGGVTALKNTKKHNTDDLNAYKTKKASGGREAGLAKKKLKKKKKGHPQHTLQRPPTNNNTHALSPRFLISPSKSPRYSSKGEPTPLQQEAGRAELTSKPLVLWISWLLQIKRNKTLLHQVENQVKML